MGLEVEPVAGWGFKLNRKDEKILNNRFADWGGDIPSILASEYNLDCEVSGSHYSGTITYWLLWRHESEARGLIEEICKRLEIEEKSQDEIRWVCEVLWS